MNKTWDQLVYMQDMNVAARASQTTPAASATTVPTKTLTDSRDGNTYTIAKLKDGNRWMTQNLRLVGNKMLIPNDSDVSEDFFLPESVVINKDTDTPKQFAKDVDTYQAKVYFNPSQANYEAYYNWYTATAGWGMQVLLQKELIRQVAFVRKDGGYLLEDLQHQSFTTCLPG